MLDQSSRQTVRQPVTRHDATARVVCESLELQTTEGPSFHDLTDDVLTIVADSGVVFGSVTVFSTHTTAAVRINEAEPLLLRDMARVLRQLAPANAYYEHNDFGRRTEHMTENEPLNGHSHCQHLFLSTSETVPVIDGKPALGEWQRIFLIELDHARPRRVLVTVNGTTAS